MAELVSLLEKNYQPRYLSGLVETSPVRAAPTSDLCA